MSKKLLWVLAILGLATPAWGQANFNMPPPGGVVVIGVQVVPSCGAGSLAITTPGFVTMDQTGVLCTSASVSLSGISLSLSSSTNRIGYVSDDPCTQLVKITSPISLTSSNIMIAALSGTTKPTVCSIVLISDTATKASLVEGVGNGCTTGATGVIGGVTATLSGMSFAANGGITLGNGGGTVAAAKTAGNALCIWQSAAQLISGSISLVYAP